MNISSLGDGSQSQRQANLASIAAGFTYVLGAGTGQGSDTDIGGWGSQVASQAMVVAGTDDRRNNVGGADRGPLLSLWAPAKGLSGASSSSDSTYTIPENVQGGPPGDSFAAPFVSGVVALYLEPNKNASPATVKAALLASATRDVVGNAGSSPNRFLYSRVVDPMADLRILLRRCTRIATGPPGFVLWTDRFLSEGRHRRMTSVNAAEAIQSARSRLRAAILIRWYSQPDARTSADTAHRPIVDLRGQMGRLPGVGNQSHRAACGCCRATPKTSPGTTRVSSPGSPH